METDAAIPEALLPPGFARHLDRPPAQVAVARPAATIALLRSGAHGDGLEVLLLQRIRSAGFVPGAWVFPGGRVDEGDAAAPLVKRLCGLGAHAAAERLGLERNARPPALAYYVAAIREAFEETGILVGHGPEGRTPGFAARDAEVQALRHGLMAEPETFADVLDCMGSRMDGAAVAYVAHWITPEAEPRRFDTRFFAAVVPEDAEPLPDEREASHALWLTPEDALARNRAGHLPMVFPTIHTLRALLEFEGPAAAVGAFRDRPIPTILPRLVRTGAGVGIEVDAEG